MEKLQFEISVKTIVKILLVIVGFLAFLQIYQIVIIFFIAFILSSALSPLLDKLTKKKLSKGLSIALIYLGLLLLLALFIFGFSVPVIDQVQKLIQNIPNIFTSLLNLIGSVFPTIKEAQSFSELLKFVQTNVTSDQLLKIFGTVNTTGVGSLITGIGSVFSAVFGALFNILMVLTLTGFLLAERGSDSNEKKIIKSLLGKSALRYTSVFEKVQAKLGSWLLSQMVLCLLSGTVTWLIFTILGFEFALPVAMIAAFLVAIPAIGPAILMPLAALIALGSGASPILVVVYIIVYAIYQQIENIFIQPRIMQRAVGINPIITLMGVLVGTQLAGVAGALITIPAVVVIQILLTDYMEHKES